jgi:mRNA interferase RelE/StbE
MAIYRIEWKHSAVKELRKLPKEAILKILITIEGLADNPFLKGTRKLVGSEHLFRVILIV